MSDGPGTIWINHGIAERHVLVRLLREAAPRLTVWASHRDPHAPIMHATPHTVVEPRRGTSADAYVDWALRLCQRHAIELVMPERHAGALMAAGARFAALGARIQAAPAEHLLGPLQDKALLYAALADDAVPIPPYRVVSTPAAFAQACDDLQGGPASGRGLCIKPAVGIYGRGFRRLDPTADPLRDLLDANPTKISPGRFSAVLAADGATRWLVMPYLSGTECSVDCLCHRGVLVAAVVREKHGRFQRVRADGPQIAWARLLAARFALDGLVNIQFRKDHHSRLYLLEINPRPAGGLLYATVAGVNLPYWAAMLGLGRAQPHDVPMPTGAHRVIPVADFITVK